MGVQERVFSQEPKSSSSSSDTRKKDFIEIARRANEKAEEAKKRQQKLRERKEGNNKYNPPCPICGKRMSYCIHGFPLKEKIERDYESRGIQYVLCGCICFGDDRDDYFYCPECKTGFTKKKKPIELIHCPAVKNPPIHRHECGNREILIQKYGKARTEDPYRYCDACKILQEDNTADGFVKAAGKAGYSIETVNIIQHTDLQKRNISPFDYQYLIGRSENDIVKTIHEEEDRRERKYRQDIPFSAAVAVYGAIIGDALGVPFEFCERGTFRCIGMTGYGTHNQPSGTWSDDSSMLLATCSSLKENKGRIDIEDIRYRFNRWLMDGSYTPFGEVFDVGETTKRALFKGKGETGERSNGNGSLMRILPLAFTNCSDEEVRAVSAITHAHWISQEACVIYVNMIRECLRGRKLADVVHSLSLPMPFQRISTIDTLDENEIRSSGYVVDTLEAAVWCTLTTDTFKDCLLKAVNLGDDTDTVASIAGGLAAACCYTYSDIPNDWVDSLQNRELIGSCVIRWH